MDIEFLRSISSEDQTDIMTTIPDDHFYEPSTNIFTDQLTTNSTNLNPNYLIQDSNFTNPDDHMQFSWRNNNGPAGDIEDANRKPNSMAAMREMIFRIAAMQPVHIDPESIKPPKRRNVKISKDPQSVAARHRRERISERIRILQRLVPGGTKMDTASMLDEAIHYLKFLKNQVQTLEKAAENRPPGIGFPVPVSSGSYVTMGASVKVCHEQYSEQNVHHSLGA